MPGLSKRITTLNAGGSDGWELFYKAKRMIAEGIAVTELTIGEHDIRTDPAILEAMHAAAMGGHTGYALIPGTPALRDRIAARVTERTGVPTTRDNVLVTPGGQAALFAAHMGVCDPGDSALFIDPHYATYPGTIRGAGAVPQPVAKALTVARLLDYGPCQGVRLLAREAYLDRRDGRLPGRDAPEAPRVFFCAHSVPSPMARCALSSPPPSPLENSSSSLRSYA